MPESVLKIVLTIRFATYGRFFKKAKMSENRQKTSKTKDFLRFFHVRSNSLRDSGCRVKNQVFCVFGVPKSVLRIVLTIRFATRTHSRFFKRAKISEKSPKTLKTEGFLRYFHVRSNPLREFGHRVSKTEGFLRFWCARICANNLFCCIRPLQTLFQGEKMLFFSPCAKSFKPGH